MNTNYKANPDSFKANDFLYEENASGSIKDVYGEIKKAADSAKNKTLRKNSEALFVPYSETSNGTTYKNEITSIFTALHLRGIVTKPILTQMPNVSE